MTREDEFAVEWTHRTPLVTVTYPKGWKGVLPKDHQLAARKARVLVPPIVTAPRVRRGRAKKVAE
jgi:hypothetical protein